MATYKYKSCLYELKHEAFDEVRTPGMPTPWSGIYRCLGCGLEDVSVKDNPLPPQDHHQHTVQQGSIRWQLIVYADHQPK